MVDRKNNRIKWIVDGKERASCSCKILGETGRILMPYVDMRSVGDII